MSTKSARNEWMLLLFYSWYQKGEGGRNGLSIGREPRKEVQPHVCPTEFTYSRTEQTNAASVRLMRTREDLSRLSQCFGSREDTGDRSRSKTGTSGGNEE